MAAPVAILAAKSCHNHASVIPILFEMGFEGPKWSDTRPIGLMIILDK
jgi:predicted metal-dependent RNase